MRTTTLEDTLYGQALELAEPGMGKAELISEALKAFIRVQAAKRLAALGDTVPDILSLTRRPKLPKIFSNQLTFWWLPK
ncbi:type II toxin-antitoxin system VapB family antitoxin [Candidatus Aalborgicola defluviihabitans]|uniref:type II toxin-antitoxin system VapB family antitoxin n=1 Tax=Candidatus Aalborgicola defluviihabitans TaxID=3386187 RepID=UPI00390C13DF|nr:type II toxin-antitoxin system VapB family antitoxin [Burkholderiales bacterium]